MEKRPEKFLKSIADVYFAEYKKPGRYLSDVCFVFPNKRSGTFFLEYLKGCVAQGGIMAPEVTTIADFVETLSGRVIDSRVDLLLRLYRVYCDYLASHGSDASKIIANSLGENVAEQNAGANHNADAVDFDSFRVWGEMVLGDFNDIEMYMVDTSQIFKNVHDVREIASTYLTEEQINVMQDYFGVADYQRHLTNFWQHYNNPEPIKKNKKKFFKLWEILDPLYAEFCKSLESDGLAFSGLAYRYAWQNIIDNKDDISKILPYKRIVFVGFNALSTVEFSIFTAIKRISVDGAPLGDFYWDYTDGPMSQEKNSAGHFVSQNVKYFPSQYEAVMERCKVEGLIAEKLEVISSPSGVAQTKIIGELLKGIYQEIGAEGFNRNRVAVVLPDEGLLLPLLYSLPESFTGEKQVKGKRAADGDESGEEKAAVNITMGYSLKNTSASALVTLLRKLQRRKKLRNDRWEYMREDVIDLLSHPFVRIMLTTPVVDLALRQLNQTKRMVVELAALTAISEPLQGSQEPLNRLRRIFAPLTENSKGVVAMNYVKYILDQAIECVSAYYADVVGYSGLEVAHLKLYRMALNRLSDALDQYKIQANVASIFSLIETLLSGEMVTFEGEPLMGLQIMGPLETRCLDFDYIIIPSMNERIYPRKLRSHTFIPNSLRYGYRMATTRFQESIFAYNFYRMISRAKQVYMIYDARNEGMNTGDVSRYVMQLRYLYAKDKLQFTNYRFSIETDENEVMQIPKIGKVKEALDRFFTTGDGAKCFSASSLLKYIECPMSFCLSKLMNVVEKDEPVDFLSAASVGNIVHAVMADLYLPNRADQGKYLGAHPVTISKQYIEAITDELINAKIRRCICEEKVWSYKEAKSNPPVPETLLDGLEVYMDSLRAVIKRTLEHDKTLAPILFYGSETKENSVLDLGNGVKANMKFIIDRMDSTKDAKEMRIIDYKTGKKNVKMLSVEECFSPDNDQHAPMQLMFYAQLFKQNHPEVDDFHLEIYNLQNEKIASPIKIDSRESGAKKAKYEEVKYHDVEAAYAKCLSELVGEIYDVDKPFLQAPISSSACNYCPFKTALCNRG